MNDEFFMRHAIELARKGLGSASPNPAVGAVITKGNKIIADGYHKKAGAPHAEIEAINASEKPLRGAAMYVTLEPCDHFGRTPPCTDKIIEAGIKKVVIGMKDPNPLVCGRGIKKLQQNAVDVKVGLLENEIKKMNECYIKHITTGLPFVMLKGAITLDGKIASTTGDSKWISSPDCRAEAHKLRSEVDAVVVGINTVLKDNPLLTCRTSNTALKNPIRVILDSKLKMPLESKICKTANVVKTIIVTMSEAPETKKRQLEDLGCEILMMKKNRHDKKKQFLRHWDVPTLRDNRNVDTSWCRNNHNQIALPLLMRMLGKRGITSILLEGGGTLNYSFLKDKLVDKVILYIAPKIIGGRNSPTLVDGEGIEKMKNAIKLRNIEVSEIAAGNNKNIKIVGYLGHRKLKIQS